MKTIGFICFGILLVLNGLGNNVRIVGSVKPSSMPSGNIVSVNLTLEWENSWRDIYNYDAVYLVLKYRKIDQQPTTWHSVYLENTGHITDNGFTYSMAPGTTDNRNVGVFVYRASSGTGIARTNVELKWDFVNTTSGEEKLTSSDFYTGKVLIACTGIEMVYIPRGVFALGDMANTVVQNASIRTFRQRNRFISEENDVVSDRYWIESGSSVKGHPASLAANHENDLDAEPTNAWIGGGEKEQSWRIDFGRLADGTLLPNHTTRNVKYIAIESVPGRVPRKWELWAADVDETGHWQLICSGTEADWGLSTERAYPPTKAIKVTTRGDYRYYSLNIKQEDMPSPEITPVVRTIAMTEKDLATEYDYTFIVDTTVIKMGGDKGLSAENDGEEWSEGVIPATYPNGYGAFFVMKYEMSQQQYADFLHMLPPTAQKARSVGEALTPDLPQNAYVFSKDPTRPSARNGIVVASWSLDTATFNCNLNASDPVGMDGDGMPIACNFLTPEDMLAYASWAGLRPLTELEYERMAKAPYPAIPQPGACAWGNRNAKEPGELLDAGMNNERVSRGNANFKSVIKGPLRVGAFASSSAKQEAAGASFWGVMNLSDNLSEIYYNANTEGRKFDASVPANGELPGSGIASVGGWVTQAAAFGLRGGNYKSVTIGEMAVAQRNYARGYITDTGFRDSTVTFRLGLSCKTGVALTSVLTLENGLTTAAGTVADTICAGVDYQVVGNEPKGELAVSYFWYKSENEGKNWELMKGEYGKDLNLHRLTNQGRKDHILKEYWLKRKVIRDNSDGMSGVVKIKIVNPEYTISRHRDTLDGYGTGAGIAIKTKYPTTFNWYYLGSGEQLNPTHEEPDSSYYLPTRDQLLRKEEKEIHGDKMLMVQMNILETCDRSEVIPVHVINLLDEANLKVKDFGSYRAWGDGTYAPSAEAYRRPSGPYQYRGETGSGIYRIDPDGRTGPIEPFDVYCDMETDEGGWTLFGDVDGQEYSINGCSQCGCAQELNKIRITDVQRYIALVKLSSVQRIKGIQQTKVPNNNSRSFWYTYSGTAIGGICDPVNSGAFTMEQYDIRIDKDLNKAYYRNYMWSQCTSDYVTTSFEEMWFK